MSQPPEYPGPADPQGGNPPGYPPPGRHSQSPPPPGYSPPPQPPNYGAPPQPPSYSPPPDYGQPQGQQPGQPEGQPDYGQPQGQPDYGQPQGQPPGQPGGYSAPGYSTPPPPPGYGAPSAPPPGYPAPGYGGGPTGAPFSVGEAFSWAWGKFTKNAAAMAVPAAIFVIGLGILGGIMYASVIASILSSGTSQYDPETGMRTYQATDSDFGLGSIAILSVFSLLLAAVGFYMQASFASGSLDVADGKQVTIGSFLKPRNFGPVILTALLVVVGVSIGSVLCYIPGLIFAFLSMFAIQFAVDRSLSPVDSIKASIALVRANVGPTLLSWLVQGAVVLVGEFACGIGLIVAIPVAILIQVYTYRTLTGGHVAPLEQAGLPPGQYPGQPGQYPGQPGQYPGQPGQYPGQPGQYPGQQYS